MQVDVLVVGAGPVGLTMAAEAARYGLRVRIVEKAATLTDKSKALVVWSRTLELMDRAGCAAALVAAGHPARAANIVAGKEQIARFTFDAVDSAYPYGLMLPQSETERILEEHLGTLGMEVERSVELVGFTATSDGVTATIRKVDGTEETVDAGWMVGCDGAHSTVRHALGMEFVGKTMPSDWILADAQMSGVPNPGEIEIIWHADGVLAFFPIKGDRYRMIADIGKDADKVHQPDPTLEDVQAVMDRRGPGGIVASSPLWLAGFHINERKVKDYRAGRVFLAGDAAHIHSPAGGQGMNTGMQDACNLAWKLALVQAGVVADEPLLDSYSAERSAVGDQVLKAAGVTTEVGIVRGALLQAIRNRLAAAVFGFAAVREKAAETLTELSIGYMGGPLSVDEGHAHGGPRAGERAPLRAGEVPVGAGNRPKFVLFANRDEAAAKITARFADLLEEEVRPPFVAGGIWLVRPDGYVGMTARAGAWEKVEKYLDWLVGANKKGHGGVLAQS